MKKLKSIILGFLVLMLCLTLTPNLNAYATTGVDLIGDSALAEVSGVRYGVSYSQTGYLCSFREILSDKLELKLIKW